MTNLGQEATADKKLPDPTQYSLLTHLYLPIRILFVRNKSCPLRDHKLYM